MKIAKTILSAMAIALASTGLAMAAGTVQVNQIVDVSADVENTRNSDLQAAVMLVAYDTVGNEAGHLCQEITLAAASITTVQYAWRAPTYATGLYWSPKVDINGACGVDDNEGTDGGHDGKHRDHKWEHGNGDSDSDSD